MVHRHLDIALLLFSLPSLIFVKREKGDLLEPANLRRLLRPALLVTLLILITGCSSGRAAYFEESIGKASQADIANRLGRPVRQVKLGNGEEIWIYRYSGDPMQDRARGSWCAEYDLTFTKEKILKAWRRETC
jgi:hypothetical protein